MAGWIVGIYMVLGIALVIYCECINVFDDVIEEVNERYWVELDDIQWMIVKGLMQLMYMLLWWAVAIMAAIVAINEKRRSEER